MAVDRREFIWEASKLLFLTGAAATALPHVLAGEPEAFVTLSGGAERKNS